MLFPALFLFSFPPSLLPLLDVCWTKLNPSRSSTSPSRKLEILLIQATSLKSIQNACCWKKCSLYQTESPSFSGMSLGFSVKPIHLPQIFPLSSEDPSTGSRTLSLQVQSIQLSVPIRRHMGFVQKKCKWLVSLQLGHQELYWHQQFWGLLEQHSTHKWSQVAPSRSLHRTLSRRGGKDDRWDQSKEEEQREKTEGTWHWWTC